MKMKYKNVTLSCLLALMAFSCNHKVDEVKITIINNSFIYNNTPFILGLNDSVLIKDTIKPPYVSDVPVYEQVIKLSQVSKVNFTLTGHELSMDTTISQTDKKIKELRFSLKGRFMSHEYYEYLKGLVPAGTEIDTITEKPEIKLFVIYK